jgi:hypothetical protein
MDTSRVYRNTDSAVYDIFAVSRNLHGSKIAERRLYRVDYQFMNYLPRKYRILYFSPIYSRFFNPRNYLCIKCAVRCSSLKSDLIFKSFSNSKLWWKSFAELKARVISDRCIYTENYDFFIGHAWNSKLKLSVSSIGSTFFFLFDHHRHHRG